MTSGSDFGIVDSMDRRIDVYAKVTPRVARYTGKPLYVVTYEGTDAYLFNPQEVYFPHVEDADLYADAVNRGELIPRG